MAVRFGGKEVMCNAGVVSSIAECSSCRKGGFGAANTVTPRTPTSDSPPKRSVPALSTSLAQGGHHTYLCSPIGIFSGVLAPECSRKGSPSPAGQRLALLKRSAAACASGHRRARPSGAWHRGTPQPRSPCVYRLGGVRASRDSPLFLGARSPETLQSHRGGLRGLE